jgi:hypothetical protein
LDQEKWAVRRVPDRPFFVFERDFFVLWWSGVFAGVFAQNAGFGVVFLW